MCCKKGIFNMVPDFKEYKEISIVHFELNRISI